MQYDPIGPGVVHQEPKCVDSTLEGHQARTAGEPWLFARRWKVKCQAYVRH